MSINWSTDMQNVVYPYSEIYVAHATTWMILKKIMLQDVIPLAVYKR